MFLKKVLFDHISKSSSFVKNTLPQHIIVFGNAVKHVISHVLLYLIFFFKVQTLVPEYTDRSGVGVKPAAEATLIIRPCPLKHQRSDQND